MITTPQSVGVYVHLPWCIHKCPYCDFNSHEASQEKVRSLEEEYVDTLVEEFNFYQDLIKKSNLNLNLIEEGSKGDGVTFKHFPLKNEVSLGKPDILNASYTIDILSYGALGCLKNDFRGLITGPINKALINQSGFEFSGHTEFLADISNVKKVVMLLMNSKLKIALLTTHIPLSEVPSKITAKNLDETVSIISKEFKNIWKVEYPSICILGLNPHAGENGKIGSEELLHIKPAIKDLKRKNINVSMPLSADTAFSKKNLEETDAFLGMYHDQVLPVLKALSFSNSINITLGVPIIRTSVDHGVALDIAGTKNSDTSSLELAIITAKKLIK